MSFHIMEGSQSLPRWAVCNHFLIFSTDVLFVRKVDFWVSFPSHQKRLWDGSRPVLTIPMCQFFWWVGNETQKSFLPKSTFKKIVLIDFRWGGERCCAVKLQKCFVNYEMPPDFPVTWGHLDDWIDIFVWTYPLTQGSYIFSEALLRHFQVLC